MLPCEDSISAQFSELPAGASRLHFCSLTGGKTAPVACRTRSARRGCARGLLRPEACSHLLPVAARTTVPRPGTRASGLSAGLVGCQDRLDLEEAAGLQRSDVPAWPRSGDCRSRTGAGRQRPGEKDKSCLAPLEQHVGRGFQEQ